MSSFERTKFRNSFFSSGDEKEKQKLVSTGVRIAEESQRPRVRETRISDHVPDDVGAKEPSFWIIGGQEFDDAEPVLLMLPVWLEIVFVLRCQDRQVTFFQSFGSRLAVQERYNQKMRLSVPSCSLQGGQRSAKLC